MFFVGLGYCLGGPPHPVTVSIRDKRDYIRVRLYSYDTTITGWGGPPKVLLWYLGFGVQVFFVGSVLVPPELGSPNARITNPSR